MSSICYVAIDPKLLFHCFELAAGWQPDAIIEHNAKICVDHESIIYKNYALQMNNSMILETAYTKWYNEVKECITCSHSGLNENHKIILDTKGCRSDIALALIAVVINSRGRGKQDCVLLSENNEHSQVKGYLAQSLQISMCDLDSARARFPKNQFKRRKPDLKWIRINMIKTLSADELEELCFDLLGFPLESLIGKDAGTSEKIQKFIERCNRVRKIEDLISEMQNLRPHVNWLI